MKRIRGFRSNSIAFKNTEHACRISYSEQYLYLDLLKDSSKRFRLSLEDHTAYAQGPMGMLGPVTANQYRSAEYLKDGEWKTYTDSLKDSIFEVEEFVQRCL